jgi:hypothetical protein
MGYRVTAQNVRNDNGLSFPIDQKAARKSFKKAASNKLVARGSFSMDALHYGAGYESVGEYDLNLIAPPSGPGNDEYFIHGMVIKIPGKEDHHLPNEVSYLEPLIWQVAHHEYAQDNDIKNKICFLTMRTLALKADEKQIAQGDWHAHKPPTLQAVKSRMLYLDISPSSLHWVSRIDHTRLQSEYMVSDLAGTLIQTAPSEKPLELTESDIAYTVDAPTFAYRQAENYEIVHGNGYTFHAAAEPKPEEIGELRTFVLVTYAPSI